jgi:hypothetical protein
VRAALALVQPAEILLFAQDPGMDAPEPFLKRLGGLVRFVLGSRAGRADIEELAGQMAHRRSTVEAGLEWLAARGQIEIVSRQAEGWLLSSGMGEVRPRAVGEAQARLEALLQETAAFRDYWRTAPPQAAVGLATSIR